MCIPMFNMRCFSIKQLPLETKRRHLWQLCGVMYKPEVSQPRQHKDVTELDSGLQIRVGRGTCHLITSWRCPSNIASNCELWTVSLTSLPVRHLLRADPSCAYGEQLIRQGLRFSPHLKIRLPQLVWIPWKFKASLISFQPPVWVLPLSGEV